MSHISCIMFCTPHILYKDFTLFNCILEQHYVTVFSAAYVYVLIYGNMALKPIQALSVIIDTAISLGLFLVDFTLLSLHKRHGNFLHCSCLANVYFLYTYNICANGMSAGNLLCSFPESNPRCNPRSLQGLCSRKICEK